MAGGFSAIDKAGTEESILNSTSTEASAVREAPFSTSAGRSLHVLTLTPFYPSLQDPAQGCFVAEPLLWTEKFGISNEVRAVQPFYRDRLQPIHSAIPAAYSRFFCLPGNPGLPASGRFLAASITRALTAEHKVYPFDLIHAHSAIPCGVAAASLARRLHIPFVVSVHGLDAFSVHQAARGTAAWCRRESRRVYDRASAVICISGKVRDQVSLHSSTARTVLIHNGVDEELFSPGPERWPLTILSVGNLIPTKGHASLLRAFAAARKLMPECKLQIVGDGPEREPLEHLAVTLGVIEHVRFLGRKTRAEVADAMRRCAIFALPSGYEGLGCVYLEAMASGKPAIGCRGQGIDEIIEHGKNGLLVSSGDEPALVESLRMLLLNQEYRRRLGAAARATVLQSHTLALQAKKMIEVYLECKQ